MIQSSALLKDLKAQLKLLQVDLRSRAEDRSDRWGARLEEEYAEARKRERTGHSWVVWRDNEVDQAAVAWLVATTFIRFCEDNDLLAGAQQDGRAVPVGWIAGPGDRTQRAEENLTAYFRANPTRNRRDWLRQAFAVLAAQPAGAALVDQDHNPVWTVDISAERASALIEFWRETTATGELVHDFTDHDLGTRFLGDLYQDLSEHAKKTYALLQTPEFVEEFILDQTLTPALVEFGHEGLKIIDPTCGSGHFLLGAFQRMVTAWAQAAPALDAKERVRRAMDSIYGVDLNPFAVAIARFRLTVAGLLAMGERSLAGVPSLGFHLAIGDSLLGEFGGAPQALTFEGDEVETFLYDAEDLKEYAGILQPGQYHVVVGNPPYIAPPDKALRALYRKSYKAIKGKYVLSIPFMELFFRLAIRGEQGQGAGYIGKITSNSFMKREFGEKIIEWFFAGHDVGNPADLTAVIDSSGAWIPGHNFKGTPTVILIGRRRRPGVDPVVAVLGKRGNATPLDDPATGPVWREIVEHHSDVGFDGQYVAVARLERKTLTKHPWSLSGGGVDAVMESIEAAGVRRVIDCAERIGFFGIVGYDDVFVAPESFPQRHGMTDAYVRLVVGDEVRDFELRPSDVSFFPYDAEHQLLDLNSLPGNAAAALWPYRSELQNRSTYEGVSYFAGGRPWWEWHQLPKDEGTRPETLAFAEVATHCHFSLDRTGLAFKQTAPVLKFSQATTDSQIYDLLGILNSSVACFWLREVSYPKDKSKEPWETRHQFGSTKVGEFPLPPLSSGDRGLSLDLWVRQVQESSPREVVATWLKARSRSLEALVAESEKTWTNLRARMIFGQEELDWETYFRYGLVDRDLTYGGEALQIELGERAFEIALARLVEAGEEETAWFSRHRSTPTADLPLEWPEDYSRIVQERLDLIATDPIIRLLERPQFKRRWVATPWADQLKEALEAAILDRLDEAELWRDGQGPVARSVRELADLLRSDELLRDLVEVLTGDSEADLAKVLSALVVTEAVPYLAVHRYKPSGLEKFREWQELWELQRRQDAGQKVDIAVPPKYNDKDFRRKHYWQARGKVDLAKERFILYPDLLREADGTVVLGWAGWNHRDQALALGRDLPTQETLGADGGILIAMLAGLVELEPWVHQWHRDVDPAYGVSPAQVITGVIDQYLGRLETTREHVTAWAPPVATRGRRPRIA